MTMTLNNGSTLASSMRQALAELLGHARLEAMMPEQGAFLPLSVAFQNPEPALKAGRIHLVLRPGFDENTDMRFVDVRVETPSGQSAGALEYPFMGRRADILKALENQQNDPTVLVQITQAITHLLLEADKA